jgi:hypothetical protein
MLNKMKLEMENENVYFMLPGDTRPKSRISDVVP